MRGYSIIASLVAMLITSACQTSAPVDHPQAKVLTNSYTIGYYVGYSELCSEYEGYRPDLVKIQKLVTKYGSNPSYKTGFHQMNSLKAYDKVTGLNDCMKVNASLLKTYHNNFYDEVSPDFAEWKKVRLSLGEYNIQISQESPKFTANTILKMSAANLSAASKNPKTSRHISEYFELMPDQYCRLSFRYNDQYTGTWMIACEDGVRGAGKFSTEERTRRTTASGQLDKGDKFDFTLYPRKG